MRHKGKSRKKSFLQLINPTNLQKEVHMYGYHFSKRMHLLLIFGVLLGSVAIGMLFELQSAFIAALAIFAACIVLPLLIYYMYQRMYEQRRFADAGHYMEQVMYSFQKNQKIYTALHECEEIFQPGQMKETLNNAITRIDGGVSVSEEGVLWEALRLIEKSYPCKKIHAVHEFMVSAEERGGDFSHSADLLVEDNNQWMRSGYNLQAEKKQHHVEIVLCITAATVLCASVLYALEWMGGLFDTNQVINIFEYSLIQITSFLFLIFVLIVFLRSSKKMTEDWFEQNQVSEKKLIMSSYRTITEYDEEKERRRSIVFAIPFLVAVIPSSIFLSRWVCIVCILISVFLLFQHRIGYQLAKETVTKELYLFFPQWLMDMALLLQNNNVYVSLSKSYEMAEPIFQIEIDKMLLRLDEHPEQVLSYTDFFKEFQLPEIVSCMKMLYSISESGIGNANTQISNLILHIHEMQGQSDKIRNEHIKLKMGRIFFFPIGGTCIKMTFDMTFGMLLMLQMMGNMNMGGGL